MKIVIDGFGGDNAPNAILDGILLALDKFDFSAIVTGDETVIKNYLSTKKYDQSRIEIVHAPEVITNDDVPTEAIRNKRNSSLVVAFDILRKDDECRALISAGSTGATLTGGFLKIGRIKGISRPALAPLLPTRTGGQVVLIDCGANVDCKPINLCHFALMGSEYYRTMFGVENPRVALLSNGVEDKKGNDLVKKTFPLMKQLPINFVGNMEAREMLSGDFDVLVADGFTGNVAMKSAEGTINTFMTVLKNEIMNGGLSAKLGAGLLKKTFKKIKSRLNYTEVGGSPFLGLEKILIKSHGSSKAKTIYSCVLQILDIHKSNYIENMREGIKNSSIAGDK